MNFFAETYTTDGCMSSQSKVSAIVEIPAPICRKQVQSFIGMVNYLPKFSKRLLELVEAIRELSKTKCPLIGDLSTKKYSTKCKKRLSELPYSYIIIQGRKQSHKQMQELKDLAHACCKNKDLSIFVSKALTEVQ